MTTTTAPIRLAVIIGSVREGRIGPRVAQWFTSIASADDRFKMTVIDLADLDIPQSLDGSGDAQTFAGHIDAADAIVIVTPEYNRGYPGPLKTAIDCARVEWFGKPVGLVAYGGITGGRCSAEKLRTVFAELNAVTMRHAVSFIDVWGQFGQGTEPAEPEPARVAGQTMLDQLQWWASALTPARQAAPLPN